MTPPTPPSAEHDAELPVLIAALRAGVGFDHPVEQIRVVQTHISYVLLTGTFAYKIKKAVKLPFLDFATLESRKFYCDEELRINRRISPEIYLEVIPIAGTPGAPRMYGAGPAFEYAVKMLQFPDADRLDRVAARGGLREEHMLGLAGSMAEFHAHAEVADRKTPFADSVRLRHEVMDNFAAIASQDLPARTASQLERVRAWSAKTLVDLGAWFRARKQAGKVRECHGDMHLANMVLVDGRVVAFDALEFSEKLRWIDVQSELAFVAMDLDFRGFSGLGSLLLNAYLERSGDYTGLRVFRHYKVYRAMVRAKVAALRARQCRAGTRDARRANEEFIAYVRLAEDSVRQQRQTPLIITHGLSGSGKSWLAERLLQHIGAVCVRSDVERRSLIDAGALEAAKRYSARGIDRTYRALARHARTIIDCGYPAIVDATFIERGHRNRFLDLAHEMGVPFVILRLQAPMEVLAERIEKRRAAAADASEATPEVLRRQREGMDALDAGERALCIEVETITDADVARIARRVMRRRSAP